MAVELPKTDLNIRIVKFYSRPKPKKDDSGKETGEMTTEDWVAYAPPGQLDRSVTNEKISAIQRIKRPEAEHHPAAETQFQFKEYILKHYDMWKAGEEAPVDGTPLAAWNALDTDMVEAFKRAGVRTVEEIRDMNDSIISRVNVPRPRELKVLAQRFLEAADQNRVAAELKRRDDEMDALKAQLAELQKSVAAPARKTLAMPKQAEAAA
jgi:hypothetical protein